MGGSANTGDFPTALRTLTALIAGHVDPAVVPEDQWPTLLTQAASERLGPLLYWAVKRAAPHLCQQPDWHAMLNRTRHSAVQNVLFQHAQRYLCEVWESAGISPIWVKGIALMGTVYPEPTLRPMSDLDVLVPFAQRFQALEAMQTVGAVVQGGQIKFPRLDDPLLAYAYYAYNVVLLFSRPISVDMHFRLSGRLLPTDRYSWFWDHTQLIPEGAYILTPEVHLLYVAAHMILHHGEGHYNAINYADVHFLVTRSALDWDAVVTHAVDLGWTYALERALVLTQTLFDTPVPSEVLAQLRAQRSKSENIAIALKLRDQDPRGDNTLNQLRYIPLWQRIRFIWYTVFPAQHFMRYRFGISPDEHVLWPYYVRRWRDLVHVGLHVIAKRLRRQ